MNARFSKKYPSQLMICGAAIAFCATTGLAQVAQAQVGRADALVAPQAALPLQKLATEDAAQPPKVGDIAADFELEDLKGDAIKLSDLSDQGPVVLILLRGFPGYQCPFCTAQVGELIGQAAQFAKANARLMLVYPGPSEGLNGHADEFVRGKDIPENFYFVLDPNFKFTEQYGLRWKADRETSYPATFVMDTERKVLFAKVSHGHGDRAKVEDILAALPE
jgi:peroxiredoxin Q/BCP